MIEFQNLEINTGSSAGLKQAELNALLAVQNEYLNEYYGEGSAKKGTCILDCKPSLKKAECIMHYNLAGGPYTRLFFNTYIRTSDEMAADSIDEMLSSNDPKSRFYPKNIRITEAFNTGIYQDGELLVMVLDTYVGTLLFAPNISLDGEVPNYGASLGLIYATAEALTIIAREDRALNEEAILLLQESARTDYAGEALTATSAVRRYFGHDTKISEIRMWREWRNRAGYHKKARVFFE